MLPKITKNHFLHLSYPLKKERMRILTNIKYDNYIEEIKKDKFFAGNIEIAISSLLFNLNISIYKLTDQQDNEYTHFTNIWKDINALSYPGVEVIMIYIIKFDAGTTTPGWLKKVNNKNFKILLVLFENNNHYSKLSFKDSKENSIINTEAKKIQKSNIKINFKNNGVAKENLINNNCNQNPGAG